MADDGTCPSHGRLTQQLDRIEEKLDSFNDRLTAGSVMFENHEGRIRSCEARATADGLKANDWRKAGIDIIKVIGLAGLSIALGMKL